MANPESLLKIWVSHLFLLVTWHLKGSGLCVRWVLHMTLTGNKKKYLRHSFLSSFQYFNTNSTFVCVNSKGDITSTVNINYSSAFYKKEPVTTVHLMSITAWVQVDYYWIWCFFSIRHLRWLIDEIKFYYWITSQGIYMWKEIMHL